MPTQLKFDRPALESVGIVFDERAYPKMEFLIPELKHNDQLAMDAQPGLVTQSNAGIPAFLTTFIDPKVIEVLVAPMAAARILGETKKGDWTTAVGIFPVIESTGEVSNYGDWNNNGSTEANLNFPQRQSLHYQTITQYGEKEMAIAGLAKIDWVSRLDISAALVLNKYQNLTYFFGVAGLQNYGLLNDPSLPAPITTTLNWLTNAGANGATVYADVARLFGQLMSQTNGLVDQNTSMVLAMSPALSVAMTMTNTYNINVTDQLKKNFPNLRLEVAPEYSTPAGQLVQLIVTSMEGQETATAAYTEKMRVHNTVVELSAWKKKKSQGTWGTIIFRPFLIAQAIFA